MRRTRVATALAALALVATTTAIEAPAHATLDPSTYAPRWCADGNPAPCLESLTRNGINLTPSDATHQLTMTGKLTDGGDTRFQWQLEDGTLAPTDTFVMTWDLGTTMTPDRTENFAAGTLVRRISGPGGTHKVEITAHPVLMTTGCDENSDWPWTCSSIASDQGYVLSGEVHQLGTDDEFMGFDQSQNPQGVNGIFLDTAPDGTQYLSTEMVNSHYQVDGHTLFVGGARFRLSYAMLRSEFGIPDPDTMGASSLSGQVTANTTGTTASFHFMQDPNGGGMIVDVNGMTFSRKIIKVRRGTIVPKAPGSLVGKRINAHRARLSFTKARARGARPTGYLARCRPAHGPTVTGRAGHSPVVVRGLKAGRHYTCMVRATSKAGQGAIAKVRVR